MSRQTVIPTGIGTFQQVTEWGCSNWVLLLLLADRKVAVKSKRGDRLTPSRDSNRDCPCHPANPPLWLPCWTTCCRAALHTWDLHASTGAPPLGCGHFWVLHFHQRLRSFVIKKRRLWITCVVSLMEKGSLVLKLWRVELDRKAFSAD